MQRAWIESRDRTCAFYDDYHQGTIARPMSALCINRETARRALFLLDLPQRCGGPVRSRRHSAASIASIRRATMARGDAWAF